MTSFSGGLPLIPTQLKERCKLIFPTRDYIHKESHFPEGVGEIILNDDYWNRKAFPRDMFCVFQPSKGRETSVNHAKICIFIVFIYLFISIFIDVPLKEDINWIYVGSHNISPSAWGRLNKANTCLSMSNVELGVIIPIKGNHAEIIKKLPFKFPPENYTEEDYPYTFKK